MRLTIEVTDEQHQNIESSAALEGKTVNEYVLDRAISDSGRVSDGDEEIKDLMEFLKPRIESAKRGNVVQVNIGEVITETIKRNQPSK